MTVTFFSSVLNHHQISLCEELNNNPDITFTFVQMIELTDERRAQGFTSYDKPYVVYVKKDPDRAYRLCMDSDVVIAGVIEQKWVNERAAAGKLTFVYKERFLKNAKGIFSPVFWKNGYLNYYRYRNKELYFLCASAYTAKDTRFIFPRSEKKFKWGYFPEVKKYEDIDEIIAEKNPASILWTARFIDLKHPEIPIIVAKRLMDEGYNFKLNMIGNGELEESTRSLIKENGVADRVKMLGSMKPEEVREHMEKSEIFLFTSDRNEGWGAVLNESMNSGCAVIANSAIGSVPFLINDGENGYMYKDGDVDNLYNKVKKLLDNADERKRIAKNAYLTMIEEWNAENATEKFVTLCERILDGEYKPFPYESGVCSKAEILMDGWYK